MFDLEQKKIEILDLLKQRLSGISEEYLAMHSYGIPIFPGDLTDRELSTDGFHDITNILIKEGWITFVQTNKPHDNIRFIYIIFVAKNFFSLYGQGENLKKQERPHRGIKKLFDINGVGELCYNNFEIENINEDTGYYKVIIAILKTVNQNSETTHENVLDYLRRHYDFVEENLKSSTIHNGVNEFFRRAKINGKKLQNKVLKKKEKLIDTGRAKIVVLNNPTID